MHKSSICSRFLLGASPVVVALFGFGVQPTPAQTAPVAAPAAAQASAPAQVQNPASAGPASPGPTSQGPIPDYTRPEIQPNQELDRDPVPSPDMEAAGNGAADTGKSITAKQQSGNTIYTLHENVDEVLLNCMVVDEQGRLVDNLPQNAFRVYEDGAPQTIASFSHQDVPVSMGILVDNSGSMRDKREAVDAAALDLVKHSNPKDVAFVVNFSDKAYLDQGFTSDVSLLEKGLAHYDARGRTAMYDAVVAAADELAKYNKQPKQVLLIITDGADDASRLTLEKAVQRVQKLNGPVVFSIGLLYDNDNKDDAQSAHDALQRLSDETGGVAYFPKSLDEVTQITNEVARVIRNQYTLGYHSTKAANEGGYRAVHVDAIAPKKSKYTVKTRNGYYPREIKQMHDVQTAQTQKPKPQPPQPQN